MNKKPRPSIPLSSTESINRGGLIRAIYQSRSIYSFSKGSEAIDLVNASSSSGDVSVSWGESRLGKGFCESQGDGNGGRMYAIGASLSKLGKNIMDPNTRYLLRLYTNHPRTRYDLQSCV